MQTHKLAADTQHHVQDKLYKKSYHNLFNEDEAAPIKSKSFLRKCKQLLYFSLSNKYSLLIKISNEKYIFFTSEYIW